MNKLKYLLIPAVICMMVTSCADEPLPFETFEELRKGGFSRLLSTDGGSFFFTDVDNSTFTFTVEYYSENNGGDIAAHEWTIRHRNNVTGDVTQDAVLVNVASSSFGTNSTSGLPEATFTFTMKQALDAMGLTIADVNGGDDFIFDGYIIMNDGGRYGPDNSGGSLQGNNGFDGIFRFVKPLLCTSDLEGTYTTTTTGTSTDSCCPDETTVESTVTLTMTGDGEYTISDWSAGLYFAWYEVYGIAENDETLEGTLIDACGNISLPSFTEPFGEPTDGTGSFDFDSGVITYTWENGWGDQATVTLTPQ